MTSCFLRDGRHLGLLAWSPTHNVLSLIPYQRDRGYTLPHFSTAMVTAQEYTFLSAMQVTPVGQRNQSALKWEILRKRGIFLDPTLHHSYPLMQLGRHQSSRTLAFSALFSLYRVVSTTRIIGSKLTICTSHSSLTGLG